MIIQGVALTPALAAWLRSAHDDGREPLFVIELGDGSIRVAPSDARQCLGLSPTEEIEVRALVAAHKADPFVTGPRRS